MNGRRPSPSSSSHSTAAGTAARHDTPIEAEPQETFGRQNDGLLLRRGHHAYHPKCRDASSDTQCDALSDVELPEDRHRCRLDDLARLHERLGRPGDLLALPPHGGQSRPRRAARQEAPFLKTHIELTRTPNPSFPCTTPSHTPTSPF